MFKKEEDMKVLHKREKDITLDDVVMGITKDMQIVNNSDTPDELLSMVSYLAYNSIDTIVGYFNSIGEDKITYGLLRDKMLESMDMYNMVDKGFTPDEAAEALGVDTDKFSYAKVKIEREN